MNFFTFISHVVSLQFKQPLFFPGVYIAAFCNSSTDCSIFGGPLGPSLRVAALVVGCLIGLLLIAFLDAGV
jgi:hypothetical protein